jgi:hypothetical protein
MATRGKIPEGGESQHCDQSKPQRHWRQKRKNNKKFPFLLIFQNVNYRINNSTRKK